MRLAPGCVQLRWIITSLAWAHTCCRVNRISSSPSRLPGGSSDVTTNAENVQRIRSKISSTDLLLSRLNNKVCCEARFYSLTRFAPASFSIPNVPSLRHTFWCGLVLPSAAAMTSVPVNYRPETASLFLTCA